MNAQSISESSRSMREALATIPRWLRRRFKRVAVKSLLDIETAVPNPSMPTFSNWVPTQLSSRIAVGPVSTTVVSVAAEASAAACVSPFLRRLRLRAPQFVSGLLTALESRAVRGGYSISDGVTPSESWGPHPREGLRSPAMTGPQRFAKPS